MQKPSKIQYDSKVWWCLNRHRNVLERFSGGISITMLCKAMRKKTKANGALYGFTWGGGQAMMRNGIHTIAKAKEISDVIFNEYGVFLPYIDLMGFIDDINNPNSEI
jgi:hypothetical protein